MLLREKSRGLRLHNTGSRTSALLRILPPRGPFKQSIYSSSSNSTTITTTTISSSSTHARPCMPHITVQCQWE